MSWKFDRELEGLGFSRRARGVLIYGLKLESVEEIRSAAWEDTDTAYGLRSEILRAPHGGPATLREVEAYRSGISPADAPRDEITLTSKIPAAMAVALDTWREAQSPPLTRSQAVAALVRAGIAFEE